MASHRIILSRFGEGTDIAAALSAVGERVDRETIYAWKRRDAIPSHYWPSLIAAAKKRGIKLQLADFVRPFQPKRGKRHG